MPIVMATTTPTSPGWQLITAALIGFAIIVLLITRFKLHPFLSLTIGALTAPHPHHTRGGEASSAVHP